MDKLDFSSFNVELRGDPATAKSVVICLHGFLGSARNLLRITDGLYRAGHCVISYDQRGHGRSAWTKNYGVDDFANDVFTIINHYGLKSVHLVGHSMGGRVSLQATSLKPDYVRTLTLLDVGPNTTNTAVDDVRSVVDPLPEEFSSKEEMDSFFKKYHVAIATWLMGNLKKKAATDGATDSGYKWIFDLNGLKVFLNKGIQLDQRENFKNLRCPTLVLHGDRSKHISKEEAVEMKKLNPSVEYAVIPNAGHWIHVDNPSATLDAVKNFLEKNQ